MAAARVEIVSDSGRWSGTTYHYVYVKLQNTGGATAYDARITVTYYNAAGAITGSSSASANLSMLRPGEFSTASAITQPAAGTTRYVVSGTYRTTSFITYVHDGLEVGELNSYRSGSFSVYVVGRIANNSGRTVSFVKLDVGVYDATGRIVDSGFTYPFSSNDAPHGASTSFSESFFDSDGHIPSGYTYSVRAEGWIRSAVDQGAPATAEGSLPIERVARELSSE